eukprot:201233-Hanusia_phi.AAC.1
MHAPGDRADEYRGCGAVGRVSQLHVQDPRGGEGEASVLQGVGGRLSPPRLAAGCAGDEQDVGGAAGFDQHALPLPRL